MTDKRYAESGEIWVCGACGKTSKDLYGDSTTSWDESCMLNAVLCKEGSLRRSDGGRVVYADPVEDTL